MTESGSSSAANKSDYSFGQIAIRDNICSFEQVKECLDIQAKLRNLGIEPKKLGEILIEKGYLSPEQAVQLAKSQASASTVGSSKLNIPGYELLSRIGQGAMGTVYKAKQLSMDRIVAIKVLSSRYSKDRTFVERFLREARAVAKLNHENIISGIDVGETNGHHYFVMEFVDGAPVTQMLKKDGKLDERRCLQIGLQVARALSHAHKHGIVHRDVKPENIMLTSSGGAKLCDLGLAKQTKGDADVTMDGTSVGTPNYISPEQARGEENIDIRADIYSLGASLYHMAVGAPPFSGANPMVVMTKHVTDFAEPPKKRNGALSEGFNTLIMKMLGKRREDRPQDPEALIQDLQKLINGEPLAAGVATPSGRAPTSTGRSPSTHHTARAHPTPVHMALPGVGARQSPKAFVVAAVLGAVALAGVIVFFTRGGESGTTTPPTTPPKNTSSTPPSNVPPVTSDAAAARIANDIENFHKLVDSQIGNTTISDRFTGPYSTILIQIEKSKKSGDFLAQKAWHDELVAYTDKVNSLISSKVFAPIKERADKHMGNSSYLEARKEILTFEDVYKFFRNDDKVEKTKAGRDQEEYLERISRALDLAYLESMKQAGEAFKDRKRRDETYGLLDAAAESGTQEHRDAIEKEREKYLRQDVAEAQQGPDGSKKGLDRIAALKASHAKNQAALRVLEEISDRIRNDQQQATSAAVTQAMSLYAGTFRPAFDEALRRRDLTAARKALHDLYFTTPPAVMVTFLPAPGADYAVLKAFLDPARTGTAETRKVVAMAEEGIKFTALRSSQYEAAREMYVDLRITALLEELLELAVQGAALASRDANRFKTGYSNALKDATLVDPAPRKASDGPSMAVTIGGARTVIPLAPAGRLSEDDILNCARRMPAATSDPQFALKAFYLFLFADKLPSAKDWLDKLTGVEARIGTERYADRFKGMTSAREEDEAKKAFEAAWDQYYRKKDTTGGARKFKEILERYSGTEYMKSKVLPSNRTRIDIVQDMFGPSEGKPKGMKSGVRELFAGAEVKDLGRGRYEVTYSGFKDDKELALFNTADGQVTSMRVPGGLQVQGNGVVQWAAPLRGNASIEVTFRPQGDGAFGLVVCADGMKSGYLAVADLPIPGVAPMDAIFKMPVREGADMLRSILSQGGTGIQQQKNAPNVGALTREGTKLRFTLNRGELTAESPAPSEGRVGIGVINNSIVIERIKITGEIDSTWLDAELKRAEGK